MQVRYVIGAAVLTATLGSGVAHAQPVEAAGYADAKGVEGTQVSDPFEGLNRGLFAVHGVIDDVLLEPAAQGYRAVLPKVVRKGVRNALSNVASPVTFVNDVLQAKPSRAGVTAARFGVNTTVGVLGIFDVGSSMGLERHTEDFGQTLGHWGIGEGPYLFIPIAGPTNLRDLTGRVVDIAFDPLTYATYDGDDAVNISRVVFSGLDAREQLIEPLNDLEAQSPDMYASLKRIYTANRRNEVADGAIDVEALPDFDDTSVPEVQVTPQEPIVGSPVPSADAPQNQAPIQSPDPVAAPK